MEECTFATSNAEQITPWTYSEKVWRVNKRDAYNKWFAWLITAKKLGEMPSEFRYMPHAAKILPEMEGVVRTKSMTDPELFASREWKAPPPPRSRVEERHAAMVACLQSLFDMHPKIWTRRAIESE